MKLTSINYQKVFPLAQYINERIGVEIQVDENDNPDECLIAAKSMVERFHKENNPHLYQEQTLNDVAVFDLTGMVDYKEKMDAALYPKPSEKISPEQQIENLIAEIENATPENILTFKLAAAQNQKTIGAYNKRKKQLNVQ